MSLVCVYVCMCACVCVLCETTLHSILLLNKGKDTNKPDCVHKNHGLVHKLYYLYRTHRHRHREVSTHPVKDPGFDPLPGM